RCVRSCGFLRLRADYRSLDCVNRNPGITRRAEPEIHCCIRPRTRILASRGAARKRPEIAMSILRFAASPRVCMFAAAAIGALAAQAALADPFPPGAQMHNMKQIGSDPANPRYVKFIPYVTNDKSIITAQVTLHDNLMITSLNSFRPQKNPLPAVLLWDISDPENPKQVGSWQGG